MLQYHQRETFVARRAPEKREIMDVKEILSKLTDEEKAALVAGTNFMYTNPVPRLGIPSLRMSDGPHGLRVQGENADNGVTGSDPATAFPTAATVACGWREENARKIGEAIGKEARHYGIGIVLGPGTNIKRDPRAGRNFEYYSEDPLLAGKCAAAEIEGVQSAGVGVSLKHFALNNSENYRFMGDSVADERAMREIYLKPFEIAVKRGKPATIMCAYNRINGTYCCENKWLLTDVLRREWGFDGLVMTDWGAMQDRVTALKAGLDLEMPGDTAVCRRRILDALKDGSLEREVLDRAVENVLKVVDKYAGAQRQNANFDAHDKLACEIAKDCAVLMKNEGMLPLDNEKTVLVAGDLFEKMRYQGAGSSLINPTKLCSVKDAFNKMGARYKFVRGYKENSFETNAELISQAVKEAESAEEILVFAGLTDYAESEGCDRENMRLPENQLALINALIGTGKKVCVVLFGGSPVELPFADGAAAILNMYLPGQSGGRACAELLYGLADPAGRLAETWQMSEDDIPFGKEFSRERREVYKESIFVGYRYYATAQRKVRYPFGYGLSYTSFEWKDMSVRREGGKITVSCLVKNTGLRAGSEVIQLYSSKQSEKIFRPLRELRGYCKLDLAAGEEKLAAISFDVDELRFFDARSREWKKEGGEYVLQLCKDCLTPLLSESILVEGEEVAPYGEKIMQSYKKAAFSDIDTSFEELYGRAVAPLPPKKPFTLQSRFSDFEQASFMGRLLYKIVLSVSTAQMKKALKMAEGTERDNAIKGAFFLKRILESNSLNSLSMSAGKHMPYNFAQGFVAFANGKFFKGIRYMCSAIKVPLLPKEENDEQK